MKILLLTSLIIVIVSALLLSSVSAINLGDALTGPPIRDLTDSDFEEVTQASTKGGGTTGDWLIFYHAPWCSFCKQTMPMIEEFAKMYPAHTVQTARVDCNGDGASTCRRFKVRAYPTILLFKAGRLYTYDAKYKRTADSLTGFAKDPSKAGAIAWLEIPGPLTFIDTIAYYGQLVQDDFIRLSGESPMVLYSLVGACGLLFLMILALAASSPPAPVAPQKVRRAGGGPGGKKAPAGKKAGVAGSKKGGAESSDGEQKPDKKND